MPCVGGREFRDVPPVLALKPLLPSSSGADGAVGKPGCAVEGERHLAARARASRRGPSGEGERMGAMGCAYGTPVAARVGDERPGPTGTYVREGVRDLGGCRGAEPPA